jgi:hypothetical protein
VADARRTHRECRNLAAVDVAKGVCHRTKLLVLGDEAACEHFEQVPRCGVCAAYEPSTDPFVGACRAVPTRPMTYPDLLAITCAHFGAARP